MAGIQAVVFDLYGTLISITKRTDPYARLFFESGMRNDERFRQARRISLTEDLTLAELVEKILPGSAMDLSAYEQEIALERASTRLYPETEEVLEGLKARGFRLGLISNLASPYKRSFFDLGLQDYFDEVIFSCDAGWRKPEPGIYRMMLNRLDIDPCRTLMTGDKVPADVEGPRAVGMRAVHLDRKNASPGSIATLEGVFRYL
jgi:HAD superfamily hydrolase (TIGR01549 family)